MTLQKDTKHYCKAKIISRIIEQGILTPCYVSNWSVARGETIELHKLWFCHDDQSHCVGGIERKYTIDMLVVLSLWHVHEITYLTQYEVMALEEASFILFKKLKCHHRNLFCYDAYFPINKLMDVDSWPKNRNGKNIHYVLVFKISTQQ